MHLMSIIVFMNCCSCPWRHAWCCTWPCQCHAL